MKDINNTRFFVTKASNEREVFSKEKFYASLEKAGIPREYADSVFAAVQDSITPHISTGELSKKISQYLVRKNVVFAARYALKNAIMELGPAGFIFERYVAAVLEKYGYKTAVGQILEGRCTAHEIDILASKENSHFFIEAKYHNERGIKSDTKVVLYTYARMLDIKEKEEKEERQAFFHQAWIVTNTKFTTKAIEYGKCRGVKMTGWRYPHGEGLESLIERMGLYPVTVLPAVNKMAREKFAEKGLLFAKDIAELQINDLRSVFGLETRLAGNILSQAKALR